MTKKTTIYGKGLTKQERRDWNKKTDAILKARTAKPSAAAQRLKAAHEASQPDAWMRLVLSSMSAEELRNEIENTANSVEEVEQLKAELSTRKAV